MNSNTVIQSYVWNNIRYFVSTIERDSSAMEGPDRYNETIAWEWPKNGEAPHVRGRMVLQDEDCRGSIQTHLRVCEKIFNGEIDS